MNIEILDGRRPTIDQARHLGSIRFVPKWRVFAGETFDQAANRAVALVNLYAAQGVTTILCMTHEVGAELNEGGFNWEAMSATEWARFRAFYVELVKRWVARLGGRNLVYQILNEMDSTEPRASVIVPPVEYGAIYREAHAAIKAIAPGARVITGGYNSGPTRGMDQFLRANISTTDGVAFHPYGASAGGHFVYPGIPSIDAQLAAWRGLGRPLYITEFGVLGQPTASETSVANYARAFIERTRSGTVATCWYDWLGGDSGAYAGYGVLDRGGQLRPQLLGALRRNGGSVPTDPPPASLPDAIPVIMTGVAGVNFRDAPGLGGRVIGSVVPNREIRVSTVTPRPEADTYTWYHAEVAGRVGYFAGVQGLRLWRLWD